MSALLWLLHFLPSISRIFHVTLRLFWLFHYALLHALSWSTSTRLDLCVLGMKTHPVSDTCAHLPLLVFPTQLDPAGSLGLQVTKVVPYPAWPLLSSWIPWAQTPVHPHGPWLLTSNPWLILLYRFEGAMLCCFWQSKTIFIWTFRMRTLVLATLLQKQRFSPWWWTRLALCCDQCLD